MIAAGVVLVAAIAVIGYMFRSRDDRIAPSIIQTGPERTPAFAFAVGRSGALPTAAIRSRKPVRTDPLLRLGGASTLASNHAVAPIARHYRSRFMHPAHRHGGTDESLGQGFATRERAQARE